MQSLTELLAKRPFNKSDEAQARYLATQGDAREASERMMMVDGAIWRIVHDPNYDGDIEVSDIED